MKLILIVNDEPVIGPNLLQELIDLHNLPITAIIECPQFPEEAPIIKRVVFNLKTALNMGIQYSMNYVGKLLYRKIQLAFKVSSSPKTVRTICRDSNIDYYYFRSVNNEHLHELMVGKSDTIIFNMCSQVYSTKSLKQIGTRLYNFHGSLLPFHRGRFPLFWALHSGRSQGITCHRIVRKLDCGGILLQEKLKTDSNIMEVIMSQYLTQLPAFIASCFHVLSCGEPYSLKSQQGGSYDPDPSFLELFFSKIKVAKIIENLISH